MGDQKKIFEPYPFRNLVNEYKSIFHVIETMKDVKIRLSIEKSLAPSAQEQDLYRPIIMKDVDVELNRVLETRTAASGQDSRQ